MAAITKMSFNEARDFIRMFNNGKPISLFLRKPRNGYTAWAFAGSPHPKIYLDPHHWNFHRWFPSAIKAVLAHEVGHFNIGDHTKSQAARELQVQMWSMKRAKEIGDTEIQTLLKEDFRNWDFETGEYKRARRMYLKHRRRK